jgi:hypothetical protein
MNELINERESHTALRRECHIKFGVVGEDADGRQAKQSRAEQMQTQRCTRWREVGDFDTRVPSQR